MSSRREEEKNEKIIRGLMKLPPNRRCINCNSLGPQYVCTNFWTFVCTTCSGIHREFTHRVKSVSMAKFTKMEVESLQNGGNQRAREIFLPDWDSQRTRLPDSSNPDRIREFIKSVYVEKKYAGGRSSNKPPKNIQTHKSFEEDHRRASSYHSYSQSPPYDYQYEDRLYGKQSGMLSRKPGSDGGGFGKMSSLIYSPGGEQMYDDRFSNEISGPRLSDFSLSSASDSLKFDGQSPNFEKDGPVVSNSQQVRDILIEDGRSQEPKRNVSTPQRSASLGSLGLYSEISVKSEGVQPTRNVQGESVVSSINPSFIKQKALQCSSPDFFSEPWFASTSLFENPGIHEIPPPPVVQRAESLDLFSEKKISAPVDVQQGESLDLFSEKMISALVDVQQGESLDLFAEKRISAPLDVQQAESLDLFAQKRISAPLDVQQAESLDLFAQKRIAAPLDVQQSQSLDLFAEKRISAPLVVQQPESLDLFAEMSNPLSKPSLGSSNPEPLLEKEGWATFDLPLSGSVFQSEAISSFQEPSLSAPGQQNSGTSDNDFTSSATTSQIWKAFDDSHEHLNLASFETSISRTETGVPVQTPYSGVFQETDFSFQKDFNKDGLSIPIFGERAAGSSSLNPDAHLLRAQNHEPKSTNPFDLPYDSDPKSVEFLDMNPLQSTLPSFQFPSPFLDHLNQPSWSTYITPMGPTGSFPYMAGQPPNPQPLEMPSQGSVSSLKGNPFDL